MCTSQTALVIQQQLVRILYIFRCVNIRDQDRPLEVDLCNEIHFYFTLL